MTTPKQSPKPADDVAAMVETGSPPITTVTLDGRKYVPAALLTRLEAYLRDCEARRLEERDRAEALLAEAVGMLEGVPGALNGMFSAGMEEREGGSARRQERYAKAGDALKAEIPAFLAKIKEKQDADA